MKRTKFAAALAVLTLLTTLTGCGQAKEADGALEPVTLNEVAHSSFYAPQYAAIELGYFKDEGIDLTLVNGAGADKVMTRSSPGMPISDSWAQRQVSMSTRKVPPIMLSILPS